MNMEGAVVAKSVEKWKGLLRRSRYRDKYDLSRRMVSPDINEKQFLLMDNVHNLLPLWF